MWVAKNPGRKRFNETKDKAQKKKILNKKKKEARISVRQRTHKRGEKMQQKKQKKKERKKC